MRTERILSVALIGIAVCFFLVWIDHQWACLQHPFPLGYGEGVTAMWVDAEDRYPSPQSDVALHNPYPPLGYLLVTPLKILEWHPFAAERLAALLAGLVVAVLVAMGLPGRRGIVVAVVGFILVIASPPWWRYLCYARFDTLAIALSLVAVVLVARGRQPPWCWALAALLAGSALLIKPMYAAALVAVLVSASICGRGLVAIAAAAVPLVLGVVALVLSDDIRHHLLDLNMLGWRIDQAIEMTSILLARHPLLMAGLCWFLWRWRPRDPIWIYGLMAICTGLVASGKPGADGNYLLEAVVVATLACVRLAGAWSGGRTFILGAACFQLGLFLPIQPRAVYTATYGQEVFGSDGSLAPGPADLEIGQILMAEIEVAADPILSEDIGYLVAAGRPVVWQPYQFEQLRRRGAWSDAPLLEGVAAKRYGLIILRREDGWFSDELHHAVATTYALRREVGPYLVYAPDFGF